MQEQYEKIFEMACEELPHRLFVFGSETAIIYRGFRISKVAGKYIWQDVRYDGFYDEVDPIITAHILKNGFIKTLTELMIHNDKERLYQLEQRVDEIERTIKYWTLESSKNYRNYKKSETGIISNLNLTKEQIDYKLENLHKRYIWRKNLYIKKRRVLKEERAVVETKIAFYQSRIRIYN